MTFILINIPMKVLWMFLDVFSIAFNFFIILLLWVFRYDLFGHDGKGNVSTSSFALFLIFLFFKFCIFFCNGCWPRQLQRELKKVSTILANRSCQVYPESILVRITYSAWIKETFPTYLQIKLLKKVDFNASNAFCLIKYQFLIYHLEHQFPAR